MINSLNGMTDESKSISTSKTNSVAQKLHEVLMEPATVVMMVSGLAFYVGSRYWSGYCDAFGFDAAELDLPWQRVAYASFFPLLIGLYLVYDGYRESEASDAGPKLRVIGSYLPLVLAYLLLITLSKTPWHLGALLALVPLVIITIFVTFGITLKDVLFHPNIGSRVVLWTGLFLGFCYCTQRAGRIAAGVHLAAEDSFPRPYLYEVEFTRENAAVLKGPVSVPLQTPSFVILVSHSEAGPVVHRFPTAAILSLKVIRPSPPVETVEPSQESKLEDAIQDKDKDAVDVPKK